MEVAYHDARLAQLRRQPGCRPLRPIDVVGGVGRQVGEFLRIQLKNEQLHELLAPNPLGLGLGDRHQLPVQKVVRDPLPREGELLHRVEVRQMGSLPADERRGDLRLAPVSRELDHGLVAELVDPAPPSRAQEPLWQREPLGAAQRLKQHEVRLAGRVGGEPEQRLEQLPPPRLDLDPRRVSAEAEVELLEEPIQRVQLGHPAIEPTVRRRGRGCAPLQGLA